MKETKYSGRTTDHAHKFDNWEDNGKNIGSDCIKQVTMFDVQWSNCPIEVEKEVIQLWNDNDLGNDRYIYKWDEDDVESYPIIAEYLKSRSIEECIIHWWW